MATLNDPLSPRPPRSGRASDTQSHLEQNQDYYTAAIRLDDLLDDDQALVEPQFDVETLLGHLIQRKEIVTARDLFVLSDLSRQNAELVRRDWPLIPTEQRQQLIVSLIHVAEDDVAWQLGRLLRIALEDSDATVRKLAIEGLWEDSGTDLIGPLVQLLHNDSNEGVRAAAASTLGTYVLAGEVDELDSAFAMRAEEALLSVLYNDEESPVVQCRALESIAYSSETGIRQLIESAYYSSEEEMRISSLLAMGRSADTRWRGFVRAELQNPSPEMRAEAARACGELEIQKADRELMELLTDEEQMVRLAAIFAIGRLGGRRAQQVLRAIANGEAAVEAEAADLALEDLLFFGDDDRVMLEDEDEDEDDNWDPDSWDTFDELDESDFGSYEDE